MCTKFILMKSVVLLPMVDVTVQITRVGIRDGLKQLTE